MIGQEKVALKVGVPIFLVIVSIIFSAILCKHIL